MAFIIENEKDFSAFIGSAHPDEPKTISYIAAKIIWVWSFLSITNVKTWQKDLQYQAMIRNKHNKQIMACGEAHWNAASQAASPLSPAPHI